MKRWMVAGLLGLAASIAGGHARADNRSAACFEAAVEGQRLRNGGKLLLSRGALVACAQASCPAEVARDCARWLGEVTASQPTVVFAAKDGRGADLTDARVALDGQAVGTTGDGRAVEVDPGAHEAVFALPDGATRAETFVARVGEKNRAIVASFAAAGALAPPAPAPPPAPAFAPDPARRSIPGASLVLGGASVLALGVFGTFGLLGVDQRSDLRCDTGCSTDDKRSVDTKFLVADVALGVSIVALASALAVLLVRPSQPRPTGASVRHEW